MREYVFTDEHFSWRAFAKALAGNLRGSKAGLPTEAAFAAKLVEPDGIEPTTSCLQSRRSPN
jgi:hypothetical protein